MFKSKFLLIAVSFILVAPFFALAEDITITTYYPSPYGSYRELRSARIAIGDNYIDPVAYTWEVTNGDGGEVDFQADLVVQGNVGIGMTSPSGKLIVRGLGTTTGVGLQTENSNGTALVTTLDNGNVGIGTTTPGAYRLNVNGDAYVGGANGVTSTIFRDLNTAYFLNPDPGSQYSHSGAIRGSLTIGESTNYSSAAALFVRRDSTAGNLSAIFASDSVGYGIIADGAQAGIHAEGTVGVSGRGGFAGMRADCTQVGCYDFYGDGPRTHFTGSVGIGTTTPAEKLQVSGGYIRGQLKCRRISVAGGAPSYVSRATCNANEWLLNGGGGCQDPTVSYLHESYPPGGLDAWQVDCFRHDGGGDSPSFAYATCCEK